MTRAKNLHGPNKTDAVRKSFENKIAYMDRVAAEWTKAKKRDDQFWPESLAELASWEDPEKEIYLWSSTTVTTREGNYRDLVEKYWKLQKKVSSNALLEKLTQKQVTVRALQQASTMIWEIVEYRDELVRLDPKSSLLKRFGLP